MRRAVSHQSIEKLDGLCFLHNFTKISTLGTWTQSETRLPLAPVPRRRN
jgi:hypothetical protein